MLEFGKLAGPPLRVFKNDNGVISELSDKDRGWILSYDVAWSEVEPLNDSELGMLFLLTSSRSNTSP